MRLYKPSDAATELHPFAWNEKVTVEILSYMRGVETQYIASLQKHDAAAELHHSLVMKKVTVEILSICMKWRRNTLRLYKHTKHREYFFEYLRFCILLSHKVQDLIYLQLKNEFFCVINKKILLSLPGFGGKHRLSLL